METNSQLTQPLHEYDAQATKAMPFPVAKGWTGLPNSVFNVYMKHPDINSTAIVVYGYLLRHYNDSYGYAFPTQMDAAISMGISVGTVKKSIAKLKKVGLISTKFNMQHGNNNYYFNQPCETIEELESKFPEIKPHLQMLEERAQKIRKEAEADKERLAKGREKKAVGQ